MKVCNLMKQRIFSAILIGLLCLGLAACNGGTVTPPEVPSLEALPTPDVPPSTTPPTPEVSPTPPIEVIRGNTVGNISNRGIIAESDGWLYYANGSSGNGDRLYKIRTDGTDRTQLTDHNAYYINVIDDWIYYSTWNGMQGGSLNKIRTDGSDLTELHEYGGDYVSVIGEWVFYVNQSSSPWNIYKIRTDGTDWTKLNDDDVYALSVVGDWIYYTHCDDTSYLDRIYKIRTDGTDRTKLSDDYLDSFNVVGDWIYYQNLSDEGKLYKVRTDGMDKTKLNDDTDSNNINVVGEWIYYRNGGDGGKLYKIRTGGSDRTKLSDEYSELIDSINIMGDWIYFTNYSFDDNIHTLNKIHTDGTERQVVEPASTCWDGTYYGLLDVGVWETLSISDYNNKSFSFNFEESGISGDVEFSDDGYAYYYDSTGQAINFKFENNEVIVDAGYRYVSLAASYTVTKPDTASPNMSPLQAFKSVLLNNAEFYSTDYKEYVTISKLTEPISTDISVKIWRFTVIDLDNDGIPEVILWLVTNMDIDLICEILRYDDGIIRQYAIAPRGFSDLKADGTFRSSSGAGDWGFCTTSFDKGAYDTDKFTFCESFLTSANNPGELYYVNHESVFEDDFWIAVDQQNAKTDAVWYDYTETNIEAMLNK